MHVLNCSNIGSLSFPCFRWSQRSGTPVRFFGSFPIYLTGVPENVLALGTPQRGQNMAASHQGRQVDELLDERNELTGP
jgi:hypothetical protein